MITEKKDNWVFCYWDEPVFEEKKPKTKIENNETNNQTNREESINKP